MALTEIVAGILMSGIMLAVIILVLKLIKDTRATMKMQYKSKDELWKQKYSVFKIFIPLGLISDNSIYDSATKLDW